MGGKPPRPNQRLLHLDKRGKNTAVTAEQSCGFTNSKNDGVGVGSSSCMSQKPQSKNLSVTNIISYVRNIWKALSELHNAVCLGVAA